MYIDEAAKEKFSSKIIDKVKIKDLLPKISKFRHYRESKNRKLYLKYIGYGSVVNLLYYDALSNSYSQVN